MICVDGKYYDPYHILQVTADDEDEHIAKAYRMKAKRYHPDKAPRDKAKEYSTKFKIVTEAYNYIRNKRLSTVIKSHESKSDHPLMTTFDLDTFNKEYTSRQNVVTDPYKFGYGDHEHIQHIEDYDRFDVSIINQFAGKKFNNEEFNKLFEYNKTIQDTQSVGNTQGQGSSALVHRTTDGFFGYNTADTGSCALVNSFNGLMITGDNFGESGVGYWGDGYSDYQHVHSGVANPQKIIQVPENFKVQDFVPNSSMTYEEYSKAYTNPPTQKTTFKREEERMCQRMMDELLEQEQRGEQFVKKYASQYSSNFVQAALNGELDRSPTLLDNLQQHYNVQTITYDNNKQ